MRLESDQGRRIDHRIEQLPELVLHPYVEINGTGFPERQGACPLFRFDVRGACPQVVPNGVFFLIGYWSGHDVE